MDFKKWPLIILAILLLIPCSAELDLISGKASSPFNLSLTIMNAGPVITIYSPVEGNTYNNTSAVLFNYSMADGEGISWSWYNINNTNNISLGNYKNGTKNISLGVGNYTLYMFANDTHKNISSKNVSFFVRAPSAPIPTPTPTPSPGGGTSVFYPFPPLGEVPQILFDVKTNILWKILAPSDILKTNIYIEHKGTLKPIDILLHYDIRDYNGTIITAKDESIAIENPLVLYRELKIPPYTPAPANYIFFVNASYQSISATATDDFRLRTPEEVEVYYTGINYTLLIIAVTAIAIAIIALSRKRKKRKPKAVGKLMPKSKTRRKKRRIKKILD